MALKDVDPALTKAGYRRPTVEEFVAADYKAENYDSYFEKYEADLLTDVTDGGVTFSRELDTLPPEEDPTSEPTPESAPAPKPKRYRPSMVYPGYMEEIPE